MRIFGELQGLYQGASFRNRLELSQSGLHKPPQAGISGSQIEGADSIIVSGGYEDDEDYGDIIIYTGHGGRDLSSGKQVTNQELVRGNLALAESCKNGLPVRVIRGAHKKSNIAPEEGYRYDGLFRVEDYWKEKGVSGFIVWRFRLRKIDGELKKDSKILQEEQEEYDFNKKTKRIETRVQRIVRDTALSKKIKEKYKYTCQVCNTQIETSSGYYAEAAHIKPLGAPHNGPDSEDNLICLCPNHHVMFDYGGFSILENFDLIGLKGKLKIMNNHKINKDYLRYHFEHFYDEKNR
ncbi:YDG/SRA domain-containing protein [Leeuwenhoekiella marinoflava]|uniref:YDG/SRA domain-containing protein n=1 Tax=Leeuwenhoekiella marinoflava TaxID=988 RepID=UPI0030010665